MCVGKIEFYLKGLGCFDFASNPRVQINLFNQECALFKREQLTQRLTSDLKQRAACCFRHCDTSCRLADGVEGQ